MAERTSGIRAALSSPRVYGWSQRIAGSGTSYPRFLRDHVRPKAGERILDIGCGPGYVLDLMPEVSYVGFDLSPEYIEVARRERGDRGEFHCMDVREAELPAGSFDAAIAIGLLHHLDDPGAGSLFRLAAGILGPEGRLVLLDPAYRDGQNAIARWLISRDRGTAVRTAEGYAELARPWFHEVGATVREDLIWLPYTHAVVRCERPRAQASAR